VTNFLKNQGLLSVLSDCPTLVERSNHTFSKITKQKLFSYWAKSSSKLNNDFKCFNLSLRLIKTVSFIVESLKHKQVISMKSYLKYIFKFFSVVRNGKHKANFFKPVSVVFLKQFVIYLE